MRRGARGSGGVDLGTQDTDSAWRALVARVCRPRHALRDPAPGLSASPRDWVPKFQTVGKSASGPISLDRIGPLEADDVEGVCEGFVADAGAREDLQRGRLSSIGAGRRLAATELLAGHMEEFRQVGWLLICPVVHGPLALSSIDGLIKAWHPTGPGSICAVWRNEMLAPFGA